MSRLTKGSFVQEMGMEPRVGVVSEYPKESHAFVKWLIKYESNEVTYYMELIDLTTVVEITGSIHEGLHVLRIRIMRGL